MSELTKVEYSHLIREFCNCVLNIDKDSPDFEGLEKCDKDFCDTYSCKFNDLKNTKLNSSLVQVQVRQACDDYCKKMFDTKKTPYIFYNKQFNMNYINSINEYCQKYNVELPEELSTVLELISLECIEFQNNNMQILDVIAADIQLQTTRNQAAIDDLITDIDEAKKQLGDINDIISEYDKKLIESERKTHESNVTILGIFSAVVLVFNGTLAFSSSILQNLNSSSIYRIVFCSLIIGLVLINVLYGLFYYINGIVKKDKQKLKPFWISNIIIILMIIACISVWWFGGVEKRREMIKNEISTSETSEVTTSNEVLNDNLNGKN